jgi:streptogramin lyase
VSDDGGFWFAEYQGNKVGRLDLTTKTFEEWTLLSPYFHPYDVVRDGHGEVWAGSMWTDQVIRLDPKTGRTTAYLLPHETNIRRVFVDNTTNPVTFWTGNNLHATIIKLEPSD